MAKPSEEVVVAHDGDAHPLRSSMLVANSLVLSQRETEGKKNEIKTMQTKLGCLPLKGLVRKAHTMYYNSKIIKKVYIKKSRPTSINSDERVVSYLTRKSSLRRKGTSCGTLLL